MDTSYDIQTGEDLYRPMYTCSARLKDQRKYQKEGIKRTAREKTEGLLHLVTIIN